MSERSQLPGESPAGTRAASSLSLTRRTSATAAEVAPERTVRTKPAATDEPAGASKSTWRRGKNPDPFTRTAVLDSDGTLLGTTASSRGGGGPALQAKWSAATAPWK